MVNISICHIEHVSSILTKYGIRRFELLSAKPKLATIPLCYIQSFLLVVI